MSTGTVERASRAEASGPGQGGGARSTATASSERPHRKTGWVLPVLGSVGVVLGTAGVLAALGVVKQAQNAAAASQPYAEPVETVAAETATVWEHRPALTAIGTVLAQRWITLRNEIAGVVDAVHLEPGSIVEAGEVLVQLDVDVELAEMKRAEADARMAGLTLRRVETAVGSSAASDLELERAEAEHAVAEAELERVRAMMERKTLVAPFRARVGLSDVHVGQYLEEGTELTTLQGVDEAVYVDVPIPQEAAVGRPEAVLVDLPGGATVEGRVIARDARTNRETRNTMLRVAVSLPDDQVQPGMSVRVRVPTGEPVRAVSVASTAIRRGPQGDFVWVLVEDENGRLRAHEQRVIVGGVVPGGTRSFIVDGLSVGDLIATSGSFKLREGAAVATAEAGGAVGEAVRAPDASVATH